MFGCLLSSSNRLIHLQVVESASLGCFQPEERSKILLIGKGGNVSCPGLTCSNDTDFIWYKVKYTHEQVYPFHSGKIEITAKTQTNVLSYRGTNLCLSRVDAPVRTTGCYISAKSVTMILVYISVIDK